MAINKACCFSLLFFLGISTLFAQSLVREQNLVLEPNHYKYSLVNSPIIQNSVSVWADSLLLVEGIDYRVNHQKAELILLTQPEVPVLRVEYILVPDFLSVPLQSWKPQEYSDTLLTSIKKRKNPILAEVLQ